jgi:hypothetical protein
MSVRRLATVTTGTLRDGKSANVLTSFAAAGIAATGSGLDLQSQRFATRGAGRPALMVSAVRPPSTAERQLKQ